MACCSSGYPGGGGWGGPPFFRFEREKRDPFLMLDSIMRGSWLINCSVSREKGKTTFDAVSNMGEGFPEPACRSRLQTTRCRCVRKRRGGDRPVKRHSRMVAKGPHRSRRVAPRLLQAVANDGDGKRVLVENVTVLKPEFRRLNVQVIVAAGNDRRHRKPTVG